MKILTLDEIAKQTLLMSIDGQPKCEFIFDGDEIQVIDPNGEQFKNELIAERYLKLLFEEANINIEVTDSNDDEVEFVVGKAQ